MPDMTSGRKCTNVGRLNSLTIKSFNVTQQMIRSTKACMEIAPPMARSLRERSLQSAAHPPAHMQPFAHAGLTIPPTGRQPTIDLRHPHIDWHRPDAPKRRSVSTRVRHRAPDDWSNALSYHPCKHTPHTADL